jgi:hypothetical protein
MEPYQIICRSLCDLCAALPLADHIPSAVAADVERTGVFEARAAVVRPHGHIIDLRHCAQQVFHELGIMLLHNWVRDGKIISGFQAPYRMIDACAAEHRIAFQESIGHRTGFEAGDAGGHSVFFGKFGVRLQIVEVRLKVIFIVKAAVEKACDELIERGTIGVEAVEVLALRPLLNRHCKCQSVDLGMRTSHARKRAYVFLTVEIFDGAIVHRQETVVCGTKF